MQEKLKVQKRQTRSKTLGEAASENRGHREADAIAEARTFN